VTYSVQFPLSMSDVEKSRMTAALKQKIGANQQSSANQGSSPADVPVIASNACGSAAASTPAPNAAATANAEVIDQANQEAAEQISKEEEELALKEFKAKLDAELKKK